DVWLVGGGGIWALRMGVNGVSGSRCQFAGLFSMYARMVSRASSSRMMRSWNRDCQKAVPDRSRSRLQATAEIDLNARISWQTAGLSSKAGYALRNTIP